MYLGTGGTTKPHPPGHSDSRAAQPMWGWNIVTVLGLDQEILSGMEGGSGNRVTRWSRGGHAERRRDRGGRTMMGEG